MTGLFATTSGPSPRQRTTVARLLHERAARERFVAACMAGVRHEGLRPVAVDPAGRRRPEETWIHGSLGVRPRWLVGALSLVLVGASAAVVLGAAPWVGLLAAVLLAGAGLALASHSRRPAVAILHASSRPLSAERLAALCREVRDDDEPWALWIFSRGGFDLAALEVARAHGVRCFERNGHGFDEHVRRATAPWSRRLDPRARPAA